MWTKVWAYIKYVAKAVMAVAVPILWEAVPEIVTALQGTFADSPLMSIILGGIAVYLVRNGPDPKTTT